VQKPAYPNDNVQRRNRTQKRLQLEGIILFGVVLCFGVITFAEAFDKPTERYTFITQSFLNVLILIAIAIQAWI
jgi:hypothetical protein